MIVTHTQNAHGQRRVYLGGKGSLESWIDPRSDAPGWTFHVTEAVTGNQLTLDDQRAWAVHILLELAHTLQVAPQDLHAVPFAWIAALHTDDPFKGRRIASPKRQSRDDSFIATAPGFTQPRAAFDAESFDQHRRSRS